MSANLRIALMLLLTCLPMGFGLGLAAPSAPAPEPAWVTPGRVLRVIDGDTLEIEIRRTIRVRMLHCWAPESHRDGRVAEEEREEQRALGIASKKSLQSVAEDRDVIVRIPTSTDGNLSQVFTLGRVLGEVWLQSDPSESLSDRQVRLGHATREKPEELK